jgi:hypothetical protein
MADLAVSIIAINSAKTSESPDRKKLMTFIATEKENNNIFGQLISLAIFVFAAYLSWSCNTNCLPSMSGIEKGFRAFFAGFFGTLYLIIYLISWSTGCRACVK